MCLYWEVKAEGFGRLSVKQFLHGEWFDSIISHFRKSKPSWSTGRCLENSWCESTCGFESHLFFKWKVNLSGGRGRLLTVTLVASAFRLRCFPLIGSVAIMVERTIVSRRVVGSSPSRASKCRCSVMVARLIPTQASGVRFLPSASGRVAMMVHATD